MNKKSKEGKKKLLLMGGIILAILIFSQIQDKDKDIGITAYFYDEEGNLLDTTRATAPGAPMFAPVCPPDTDCNQDPIEIPSTTAYVRFVLTITNTGTVDGDFTYMGATLARDTGGSPYSYGGEVREVSTTISIPAGGGTGIFSTKRQGCTVDPGIEECGFDITLADPGDATNYNYITFEILGQFTEAGGAVQESTRYFEFRFYIVGGTCEVLGEEICTAPLTDFLLGNKGKDNDPCSYLTTGSPETHILISNLPGSIHADCITSTALWWWESPWQVTGFICCDTGDGGSWQQVIDHFYSNPYPSVLGLGVGLQQCGIDSDVKAEVLCDKTNNICGEVSGSQFVMFRTTDLNYEPGSIVSATGLSSRCRPDLTATCGDYVGGPSLEWGDLAICEFGCSNEQCNLACVNGEHKCVVHSGTYFPYYSRECVGGVWDESTDVYCPDWNCDSITGLCI